MISLVSFVWSARCWSADALPQIVADPARYTLVSCKLPDQVRKAGKSAFVSLPGPVRRLEVAACEDQGGTYQLGLCAERNYLQSNAKGGDFTAMRLLAQSLEAKWDPECAPRLDEAMSWYEKAAQKGDLQAAMALSRLLTSGDKAVRADPAKALSWLNTALGGNASVVMGEEARQLLEKLEAMRRRETDLELQIQRLEQERDDRRKQGVSASPEIDQKLLEAQNRQTALADEYEKSAGRLDPKILVSRAEATEADLQIVMLDPAIMTQRSSQAVVFPITGTEETRLDYDVIGRVISPPSLQGSLQVKINGKLVNRIEEDGFFHERVPLVAKARNVTVEASVPGMTPVVQQFRLEFAKSAEQRPVVEPAQRPRAGRSVALVVGISDYNEKNVQRSAVDRLWPNLANARRDAEELGRMLAQNYGFEVEYLLDADATHDRILGSLIRLRQTVREDDQVLIYYAGHGDIDHTTTRGFWIPYDAWQQPTLGPKWIQSDQITNAIEAIKARQILLISDSCYAAALNSAVGGISSLATARTRASVIAELAKRNSRLVMTSGSFAPVPDRGMGDHSLFTGALIDSLRLNNGTVLGKDLFRRVEGLVLRRAREINQTINPQYGGLDSVGHLGGDFVLRRTS